MQRPVGHSRPRRAFVVRPVPPRVITDARAFVVRPVPPRVITDALAPARVILWKGSVLGREDAAYRVGPKGTRGGAYTDPGCLTLGRRGVAGSMGEGTQP